MFRLTREQVLIVDEVDDLVVNEQPNNHYVRKDVLKTPELRACYAALKDVESTEAAAAMERPAGVSEEAWRGAVAVAMHCKEHKREGEHYRILIEPYSKAAAAKRLRVEVDAEGRVRGVPVVWSGAVPQARG